MSQNGQTHFKNVAAKCCKIFKVYLTILEHYALKVNLDHGIHLKFLYSSFDQSYRLFLRKQRMGLNFALFPIVLLICQEFSLGPFIKNVHKIFRKTNISYLLIRIPMCAYQEVRNVSFPENFANVLNQWSLCLSVKNVSKITTDRILRKTAKDWSLNSQWTGFYMTAISVMKELRIQ